MSRYVFFISLLLATLSITLASGVFVNQLGYLTDSPKLVYTSDGSITFEVLNANSDQVVFSGEFTENSEPDPLTGLVIYSGDFSDFNSPGQYYIKTVNGTSSAKFGISDTIYSELYNKSLKGFYFQRCGTQLFIGEAGAYHHLRCHKLDGHYHSTTGLEGFKLSKGGWHDAGDYGKYVVNAGVSVGTMLLGYELFPEKFHHDNIGIPESGNGIPDLLDEVKFELDWLFTMQHDNGGVFAKLTPEQFSGMIMPETDESVRYIYEIASTATGDFAAMMAMAARIYEGYDQEFSSKCSAAAISAWEFLESHPDIVPVGGFRNPEGTVTGEYGDGNDRDERFWAAVELLKLTGDVVYQNYIQANFNSFDPFDGSMSWPNLKELGMLSYITNNSYINSVLESTIKEDLISYCEEVSGLAQDNSFKLIMKDGDFHWGSNSRVLNHAILFIAAYELTGEEEFYNIALDQMNYILGTNAHDISFVTGVGEKSLQNPHHRQSVADGIDEPLPGLVSGGPNQYLNDPLLQSLFNGDTPPAMCFVDETESYASNEIAINWNSPLVFVSGYFNKFNILSVGEKKGSINFDLRVPRNYPNPFNGSTIINFYSARDMETRLKVYDALGNKVSENNIFAASGENNIVWIPEGDDGFELSSGVYFYRIEGINNSRFDKMIFLK
ncbi:MAG: endoglucanase [Melioribacteraceae bacterium]|nr:MAG: endoglucanase [Melioribacteraceae bacterium]